jgi:hypothetical protein
MALFIWLVYILLVVCTTVVSIIAVSQKRRAVNTTPQQAIEDKHSPEDASTEKPVAKDEPGPPETTKATDSAHEQGAEQKSEDAHTKEGELMTSGWV